MENDNNSLKKDQKLCINLCRDVCQSYTYQHDTQLCNLKHNHFSTGFPAKCHYVCESDSTLLYMKKDLL